MKKIATFLIITFTLSGLNIFAQLLQNTTWQAYYPSGALFYYFYFGIDTAYLSSDNITYTAFGAYQESDNNFSMVDLPDGDCSVVDTGKYTFLLQNDTLRLVLDEDPCTSRADIVSTIYLVKILTGIQNTSFSNHIKLYPNPATDFILFDVPDFIEFAIVELFDIQGKKVLEQELSVNRQLSVSNLPKGLYMYKLNKRGTNYSGKLIIE